MVAHQDKPIAPKQRGRITTYGRPGVPRLLLREGELNIVVGGFLVSDHDRPGHQTSVEMLAAVSTPARSCLGAGVPQDRRT
jgi:hypothetical protein